MRTAYVWCRHHATLTIGIVTSSVIVGAAAIGNIELVEIAGGFAVVVLVILAGVSLTERASVTADPHRLLVIDLLLIAVVIAGLVGVTIMALPLSHG